MAYVTCTKNKKLIDMKNCAGCFYKRLPDDYSLTWCKYTIYKAKADQRKNNIKKSASELEKITMKQNRLYVTGYEGAADSLISEISKKEKEWKERISIHHATGKLIDEAIELNNSVVTKIEEYLTDKCTDNTVASALLDEDKSLEELYRNIKRKAIETAAGNCTMLSDGEIFREADEYYGINDRRDPE